MAPLYAPIDKMPAASSIRPLSQTTHGMKNGSTASTLMRSQLSLTTWLLLGAVAQSSLYMLPIRPFYSLLPAVTILLFRLSQNVLMSLGWVQNSYMDGVVKGKFTAVFPSLDADAKEETREEDVCIFLLSTRNNHPMGLLAPQMKEFGAFLPMMLADLEANAATNGYLGGSTWLSASDRTSQNEVMLTMYFRSAADIHTFAHSPVHRAGWNWFNAEVKGTGMNHIGISHEIFHCRKGGWETVYGNMKPNSMAALNMPVPDGSGGVAWKSAVVDASQGKYRTTKGRLGEGNGHENEKYGEA